MSENSQVAFLQKELDGQISRITGERNRHKRKALWIRLAIAGLSALATIVLGWQGAPFPELLKNIALVLNAAITVIAAYDIFFEPRKLWVRETLLVSKLKDLQRDLQYDLAGNSNLPEDALSQYKDDIDQVFKESLDNWVKDKANT